MIVLEEIGPKGLRNNLGCFIGVYDTECVTKVDDPNILGTLHQDGKGFYIEPLSPHESDYTIESENCIGVSKSTDEYEDPRFYRTINLPAM